MQGSQQVPSWLLLKEQIGFLLECLELLQFQLREGIILTEHALPPMSGLRMRLRLTREQSCLPGGELTDLYALLSIHYWNGKRGNGFVR